MSMNLLELPTELLVVIFSKLSQKEIIRISVVCRKFNIISKSSSLWKKVNIEYLTEKKITLFCEFFLKYPFIEELVLSNPMITSKNTIKLPPIKISLINNLLEKLYTLRSLYISNIDASSLVFPPQLKCLDIEGISNLNVPKSLFCNTTFPNKLRHLSIEGKLRSDHGHLRGQTKRELQNLLNTCEDSLTSFSLQMDDDRYLSETSELPIWLPLPEIMNCSNLTVLKLFISASESEINSLMVNTSNLPSLEVFYLTNILRPTISHENSLRNKSEFKGFQKLRKLFVRSNCFKLKKYAVNCAFPKLETFSLDDRCSNSHKSFINFVSYCRSLKNIQYLGPTDDNYWSPHGSATVDYLLSVMTSLKAQNIYESICLCSVLRYPSSNNNETRHREIINKLTFLNCGVKLLSKYPKPCKDFYYNYKDYEFDHITRASTKHMKRGYEDDGGRKIVPNIKLVGTCLMVRMSELLANHNK